MPARIEHVRPIIGMEVHVELSTRTKMFSRAPNPANPAFDPSEPNTLVDPVVLGLPGALPVMNLAAVEASMLVGLALGCRIAPLSRWDRKGYFYPDLPKGYQISQYELPLCFDGAVDVPAIDEQGSVDFDGPVRRVEIIRAHLEEDAGKLLHEAPGGAPIDFSIVDYNRAGTPLLEIVTRPDLASADEAVSFARLLRTLCRFLGATEGVMQKGHVRFEPNINAALTLDNGREVRTPVVEIKNLNSFRALRGAIEFELTEQPSRWLADGREMGPGMKSTRGWDDARAVTVPQREKEDTHDYRYFPDPDLPPVSVDAGWRERVQARLPELPLDRLRRYVRSYSLAPKEAGALADERPMSDFFDAAVDAMVGAGVERDRAGKVGANLLLQSGQRRANERATTADRLGFTPRQLGAVGVMREGGSLSAAAADELIGLLCEPGGGELDPTALARDRGMLTVRDDSALDRWCAAAIEQNPQASADVRAGKDAAIGRLVGAAMKLSAGKADAKSARERLLSLLRKP